MRTRSFKLVLILLTFAAVGRSQPAPAAPAASTDTPAVAAKPADTIKAEATPPVQTTEAPSTGASRNKDTLSVDFPDEDIRTILRNVADLFELNIVVPAALQGKTSVKLHDVTWRQVFDVVLTPTGYTFIDENGIIKIVSLESLAEEPVTTEVFILSYSKASEVQTVVTTLIDSAKGGKLTLDARSNSLIVTERPSRLNKIRPIIKQLDKATDQVMIEAKFIEVTNRDVKNLGANWGSLSSYPVGLYGLDQTIKASSIPNAFYNLVNRPGSNNNQPPTGGAAVTALFSAAEFDVILSALQTLNTTRIVSNPTIVTLNNTEASINVGEEDPIPNYTYNQERGSFEVSGFIYKQIGIILKVTPQVNASGFIKLTLAPEVSTKNGTANFGGAGGAEIPIIAVRRATTQVTLKDGYTMGIGGLLSANGTKGSSKIPVLGSIPLLGRLFSSSSTDGQTQNLLIFITAKTVSPEGASVSDIVDPRVMREMGIRREDLPGYRDGSDPFAPAGKPGQNR